MLTGLAALELDSLVSYSSLLSSPSSARKFLVLFNVGWFAVRL